MKTGKKIIIGASLSLPLPIAGIILMPAFTLKVLFGISLILLFIAGILIIVIAFAERN